MRLWEAIKAIEEDGKAIRHEVWDESLYYVTTVADLLTEVEDIKDAFLDPYDGWEVADIRKEVPQQVKDIYNTLSVLDSWNCSDTACSDCPLSKFLYDEVTICDILHRCKCELEELNDQYKLN